ncbi:hypothetical protein PRZ48_012498 [Zasmidium cellare]|uniref:MYND-type domain-containing protein n=1 Tax=Zasmidium cellare TaxID=395010 RepID=A0ABR0E509_ZASCE|nr:hypothetical protein PRZ48_012498 [Zasmidium cellare]
MLSSLPEGLCLYCKTPQHRVFLCAGCKVSYYCSRVHQRADKPDHEAQCVRTRNARNKMRREKVRLLREDPNVFEMSMGVFWGDHDTRPYMQARARYIEDLSQLKTQEAVEAALELAFENLELSKNDNMGTRDLIPALLIRVGRDQEAYNFIKWWQTNGRNGATTYLDLPDQDVFEDMTMNDGLRLGGSLDFQSALVLLKYRLAEDLFALKHNFAEGAEDRDELLDAIEEDLGPSPVINNQALLRDFEEGRDIQPYISATGNQLDVMFDAVQRRNRHFWAALVDSDGDLDSLPEWFAPGNELEVTATLWQSGYAAWEETPGALDFIRGMLNSSAP